MRSYAKVSDRLWTGSLGKAMRGDHATQSLASYLLSSPHNNMIGLFHFAVDYAQVDMGMKPKQAVKSMERLASLGFLRWDRENDRVWIVEQWRHELNADDIHPKDKRRQSALETLRRHMVSPLVAEFAARYPVTATGLDIQEAPSKGHTGPDDASGKPHRSQEQEQEQQQEKECAEPARAPASTPEASPVLVFPCAGDQREWALTAEKVSEWAESFPGVDVMAQCRKALQWCRDNPKKRKTAGGMTSFLGGWLGKAQNEAGRNGNGSRFATRGPSRHGPRVSVANDPDDYDALIFRKEPA